MPDSARDAKQNRRLLVSPEIARLLALTTLALAAVTVMYYV